MLWIAPYFRWFRRRTGLASGAPLLSAGALWIALSPGKKRLEAETWKEGYFLEPDESGPENDTIMCYNQPDQNASTKKAEQDRLAFENDLGNDSSSRVSSRFSSFRMRHSFNGEIAPFFSHWNSITNVMNPYVYSSTVGTRQEGIYALDYVIVGLEFFLIDNWVEFNVFVADPLLSGNGQNVMATNNFQSHSNQIVHTQLNVWHAWKKVCRIVF